MVRRAGVETSKRDRVASADPGLGFLASQFRGFAVLYHTRIRTRAHPTYHRGVGRDALHVRLARERICLAVTAEESPRGPQHLGEPASFEVTEYHLTCATRYRGRDLRNPVLATCTSRDGVTHQFVNEPSRRRRCGSSAIRKGRAFAASRSNPTPRPGRVGGSRWPFSHSGCTGTTSVRNIPGLYGCSWTPKLGHARFRCRQAAVETGPRGLWTASFT